MFIYLASPYSHPLKSVQSSRFEAVKTVCATLARESVPVYSPIVHWHPVTESYDLPSHDAFWTFHNDVMMTAAREMWVLAINGWKESVGVRREIKFMEAQKKCINFISPENVVDIAKLWSAAKDGTYGRV